MEDLLPGLAAEHHYNEVPWAVGEKIKKNHQSHKHQSSSQQTN